MGLAGCVSPGSSSRLLKGLGDLSSDAGVPEEALTDAVRPSSLAPAAESDELTLEPAAVLRLGFEHNRQLMSDREELATALLDQWAARREVGLRPEGEARYSANLSGESAGQDDTGAMSLSLGDTLASGATIRLGADQNFDFAPSDEERSQTTRSELSARLEQPLLKGRGREASHAQAIQAERDLVYALRSFELRRQDFGIELLSDYYDLVSNQEVLRNTRLNLEQATFLRRRSEAMFRVQLAPYLDVLRSQQQEASARQRVNAAELALQNASQRFLISLGLSPEQPLRIENVVPPLRAIQPHDVNGIQLGLQQRLDLRNAEGGLEDAERGVRLARNGVAPELNLFAEAISNAAESEDYPGDDFESRTLAGVTLELPLDVRDEQDNVQRASWRLDQAQRGLESLRDTIQVQIVENQNRLNNQRENVRIEVMNTEIARRRVENAAFRFKNGELSNRDVVEAEDALLQAKNALVRALIDHEIERLRLLRNMGQLRVNLDGALVETDAVTGMFAPPVSMEEMLESKEGSDEN